MNDHRIIRKVVRVTFLLLFVMSYSCITSFAKNHSEHDKIDKIKIVIREDPADVGSMNELGELYWRSGKRRAAIKLFRRAIKTAPDYPPPYFWIGRAYYLENKYDKAIYHFTIFEEEMDQLVDSGTINNKYYNSKLNYIAYMYLSLKRHKEAIKRYKKMLRLVPEDQRAHYNLASCYYQYSNKPSSAYKELRKAIEIDTDRTLTNKAEFFIEFIRNNPDPRYSFDLSFIDQGE